MKTDEQIQNDVLEELKFNPSVNHAHIGVSVDQGVVSLYGAVPTYLEKSSAELSALRVKGVKAVVENIEVKLPWEFRRSDDDIAHAAVNALKWHIQVPESQVKVNVEGGHLTLSGEVEWEFQKTAAEGAIKNLTGVSGVTNLISIKSNVSPRDLKEKIELALKRGAENEAKQINVEVHGSKVILSGTVHSFAEGRDACRAAWSAPGVTEVEDKLCVAA
ncbi:MAG: BON domain-containing protein [Bdellovibrionota bacterium]